MSVESFRIECCTSHERVAALRLLHNGLSPDQQAALPSALDIARSQGDDALAGLFVAKSTHGFEAAVWVQLAPGRTAVVWPPAVGNAASPDLMRAVARFLDERQIVLAQILVSPDAPQDAEALAAGDFHRLVELSYLAVDRERFPSADLEGELTFLPNAGEEPERLGRLVLATYKGTLDCPQLNGLRDGADILAGYRAQGNYLPDRWFIVQHERRDAGVLLLNTHGAGETWELVYMGIVPEVRGRALGGQIVRFALTQTAASGAERLVLAVDQANGPGLAMYRGAGFVAWDRRVVYSRSKRLDCAPA